MSSNRLVTSWIAGLPDAQARNRPSLPRTVIPSRPPTHKDPSRRSTKASAGPPQNPSPSAASARPPANLHNPVKAPTHSAPSFVRKNDRIVARLPGGAETGDGSVRHSPP